MSFEGSDMTSIENCSQV